MEHVARAAVAPNHGRLDHLDALRGLAAMLVVFQHVGTVVARHPQAPAWFADLISFVNRDAFSPGRAGVVAFFLVSGFVIPFSFKGEHPLRGFVVARALRLYPAYWISLALALCVFGMALGHTFTPRQVAANLTMAQFLVRQPDVIPAYWTLFIELVFYAMCFGAFALGWLRSARYLGGAVLVLLALSLAAAFLRYRNPASPVPVGYVNFLATMHVGTLARRALMERDERARRILPSIVAVTLISAVLIGWLAYSRTPELDSWVSSFTGIFAGYALFFHCVRRRAFVTRTTLFLGAISYSLYLLHDLPLQVAKRYSYGASWASCALGVPLAVLLVSLPLAWLVYQRVERPAVRLGAKMVRHLDARSARPLAEIVSRDTEIRPEQVS